MGKSELKLLKDINPHILNEISQKYGISYKDLSIAAGHLRPKEEPGEEAVANVIEGWFINGDILNNDNIPTNKQKTIEDYAKEILQKFTLPQGGGEEQIIDLLKQFQDELSRNISRKPSNSLSEDHIRLMYTREIRKHLQKPGVDEGEIKEILDTMSSYWGGELKSYAIDCSAFEGVSKAIATHLNK